MASSPTGPALPALPFFVSLFSGTGLCARGIFTHANCPPGRHIFVELDPHCVATLRRNNPNALVLHGDVDGFGRLLKALFALSSASASGNRATGQATGGADDDDDYVFSDVRWKLCDRSLTESGILSKALSHIGKHLSSEHICKHRGKKRLECNCRTHFEFYSRNNKSEKTRGDGWVTIEEAIRLKGSASFLRSVSKILPLNVGETMLVEGGPPCKDISGYNSHTKGVGKGQTRQSPVFISIVKVLRPAYMLMENVDTLGRGEHARRILDPMCLDLKQSNYVVRGILTSSVYFGVAQFRPRLILIAARAGLPFPSDPLPTHWYPSGEMHAKYNTKPYSLTKPNVLKKSGTKLVRVECNEPTATRSGKEKEKKFKTQFDQLADLRRKRVDINARDKGSRAQRPTKGNAGNGKERPFHHVVCSMNKDDYTLINMVKEGSTGRKSIPKKHWPGYLHTAHRGAFGRPHRTSVVGVVHCRGVCHWNDTIVYHGGRVRTVRESMRLQGFPDDFRLMIYRESKVINEKGNDEDEGDNAVLCTKCGEGHSDARNPILLCDAVDGAGLCSRGTHLRCSGRKKVPSGEWFCDHCDLVSKEDIDTMYRLVGNAVPFPLARAFGDVLGKAMQQMQQMSNLPADVWCSDEEKHNEGTVPPSRLTVGSSVLAFWSEDDGWFPGHIAKSNRDGSFKIHFDDGDTLLFVPRSEVQLNTEANATSGVAYGKKSNLHRTEEEAGESESAAEEKKATPSPAALPSPSQPPVRFKKGSCVFVKWSDGVQYPVVIDRVGPIRKGKRVYDIVHDSSDGAAWEAKNIPETVLSQHCRKVLRTGSSNTQNSRKRKRISNNSMSVIME